MINDKEALFAYLVDHFPEFNKQWESEDNYNISDNGSFTAAGLCAEFSQYYIDEFGSIDQRCKESLFRMIEWLLSEAKEGGELVGLSNCIKSCFLENISQTEAGEISKVLMGSVTRSFFDEWHVYP